MKCAVYFAGNPDGIGRIKVGITTSPYERIRALQLASPINVELLAHYVCEVDDEHRFHQRYADYHAWGEWFERNPLIEQDIVALSAGTFDPAVLPAYASFKGRRGWWLPRGEIQQLRERGAALMAGEHKA